MKEYEQIIASFEAINGNLRMRRANASPENKEFCDRQLALNTRALDLMRDGLAFVCQQMKQVQDRR